MLATMTPGEFDERYAAHQIDPGIDSWETVATLCATLINIAKGQSGDKEFVDVDDFMPGEPVDKSLSTEAAERQAALYWGR